MTINFKKQNTKQKGSLLFEMLIVISLVAIILSVGTNAMFLSMRSSKASGERDVASTLASGALESVKAITEENWQNIYSLTKDTQHYFPSELEGKWVLVEGDETINTNDNSYTRYIVINNVSRDGTTHDIESNYVSDNDDPSTQKVTVTVSWSEGSPVVISEYFFRWRNKICSQTDWSTAEPGNAVKDCPSITYDEKENIDVTDGSLKIEPTLPTPSTVAVGDSYQGGVVAYILEEGDTGYDAGVQHGLIAATSDQSTGKYWHATADGSTGATATAIGAGNTNTNTIIATYGAESNAARLCYDLNQGGYSDWYLPSKDELNKMMINKVAIGNFTTNWYWNSTEQDANNAWAQAFNIYGSQSSGGKNDSSNYVRCIRSITSS